MPAVYLSPSTQEFNQYYGGGNEEFYMNRIVDAMIPYLRASGITFTRNFPDESVEEIIEESNLYPYDLHLAIHTSYSPEESLPQSGLEVYHYAYSPIGGERAAYIFANNLMNIYYDPTKVTVIPNLSFRELFLTNSPAIFLELGYHDNPADAEWIRNNIYEIARNLVLSITQFLNIPFIEPFEINR